jgi:glutathione peroxidase
VYQFLKQHQNVGRIDWNFAKFLVDRKGVPRYAFKSSSNPLDIKSEIETLLAEPAE